MRLDALLERSLGAAGVPYEVLGGSDAEVTSVVMDSRAVVPGALFACVPGRRADGHAFAPAAVRAGAVALLTERRLDVGVPEVVVAAVRPVLGLVAAAANGDPSASLLVVGVTGTNGKTTTCTLLAAIFQAHGWPASTVGTLTQARTTPEAPELQAKLAGALRSGQRAVAMEVSSHALDQHRVEGVHFAAGVLTNLTQDHLDYHGSMERYFEAKAKLFEAGRCEVAVINGDDPYGARLAERVRAAGGRLSTYRLADATGLELTASGSRFRWRGQDVCLRLGGRFNVANALAAATAAVEVGVPLGAVAEGLAAVERVRGRFEPVDAGQDFTVLVDYAHTPDGLAQALAAARELTARRLLVVFGAGGDRDHDKRHLMGRAASRLADLAVVTSDNPRGEDPRAIIDQVLAGVRDRGRVRVVEDRARAIETALAAAGPGDVVVVAGKGHETGQEVAGGRVLPFDDAAVVGQSLHRLLAARCERGGAR